MDWPSYAFATHGKALKRLSKQRSKKKGYKIITIIRKHWKSLLTSNIIKIIKSQKR